MRNIMVALLQPASELCISSTVRTFGLVKLYVDSITMGLGPRSIDYCVHMQPWHALRLWSDYSVLDFTVYAPPPGRPALP